MLPRRPYVDSSVVRQSCECLIQRLLHLFRCSLEESAAAWPSASAYPSSDNGISMVSNSPPMNRVSPVKTTFSSPSCMYQQMLSCVWHGVCSARTVMPSPILNVSSWAGVCVTAWQSLPPMTGRPGNCSSCRSLSDQSSSTNTGIMRVTIFELPPAWSQWLHGVSYSIIALEA